VLSPRPGEGPRYSVPWFQSISQSIRLHDIHLRCGFRSIFVHFRYSFQHLVPSETQSQNGSGGGKTDGKHRLWITGVTFPYLKAAVNYQEYDQEVTGVVALTGRIKLASFLECGGEPTHSSPGLTQTSQNGITPRRSKSTFQMVFPSWAPHIDPR
jgi:hypothetical protein